MWIRGEGAGAGTDMAVLLLLPAGAMLKRGVTSGRYLREEAHLEENGKKDTDVSFRFSSMRLTTEQKKLEEELKFPFFYNFSFSVSPSSFISSSLT